MIVRFEDVITRITGNVDRYNTDLEYYVGGDQYDSSSLTIERRGDLKKDVDILGFKFHFPFKSGDVLLMARNPHLRKAGQVFFDGLCSDASYILRTKDEKRLRQNYIPIILQSNHFWDWFESHKTGGITFLLNWGMLKGYEFDLPDSDVQDSIMEKVWAAYKLKQSYQKLIIATDEMVKSRFIEMFGNPLSHDQKYPLKRLGECVEINPHRGALSLNDSDLVSFVPMPSVSEEGHLQDLSDVEFGKVKKGFTYFKNGDVLFAKITPCMENGKGAIAERLTNDTGMGSTEFHILRPIEGLSSANWALALTRLPVFREKAAKNMTGTGGQKRVPSSFLADFPIGLPPIYEQKRFAEIYKQADKSKFELKQAIEKIDKVMRALLQ